MQIVILVPLVLHSRGSCENSQPRRRRLPPGFESPSVLNDAPARHLRGNLLSPATPNIVMMTFFLKKHPLERGVDLQPHQ